MPRRKHVVQEHAVQHDILPPHPEGLNQPNGYDQHQADSDPAGPS